jgi:hypothetical protein
LGVGMHGATGSISSTGKEKENYKKVNNGKF